jgi:hypothetical protein
MPSDPSTIDPPHFCPRCGKAGPRGASLCPDCGERLALQGFCGVCERHWPLPVGADCPKHEIPLDPERPEPSETWAAGESVEWVTVARFDYPNSAHAPRLRLEAEGIPTFLEGERVGAESVYNVAIGGVRLQVPRPLADDARILLSQTWAAPEDLENDLDDAFESLAPEPGAFRRSVMKAIIVALLLLPLLYSVVETILRGF